MEISFGGKADFGVPEFGNGIFGTRVSGAGDRAADGNPQVQRDSGAVTVTRAAVSAEDIEAAKIPETALSRNDDLGSLAIQAFNLPPPPMPAFTA